MDSRNFIVTGIPRSGTSLFSSILNSFDNCLCVNEAGPWRGFYDELGMYSFESMPGNFDAIRKAIAKKSPVPCKLSPNTGTFATDTFEGGNAIPYGQTIAVERNAETVLIGSKINAPYLSKLRLLVHNGYTIIGIIRDPVYTIGSWNSPKNSTLNAANIPDDPRYAAFGYADRSDKIRCQCEVWDYFAGIIYGNKKHLYRTLRYEDIITNLATILLDLKASGFEIGEPIELPKMEYMNMKERYPDINEIEEKVKKYCPIRLHFGYE